MGNFTIASKLTHFNEGGYGVTPGDHGGETAYGISRKFWPNWNGWKAVDIAKSINPIPGSINRMLNTNDKFQGLVQAFYKKNFWDVNNLDKINDQQLANSIYDFGVNSGVGEAAKMLQRAVGTNIDGIIGPVTIGLINSANAEKLYNEFNDLRKEFYEALALKYDQHQFLASWLSRLIPYKSV